VAKEVNWDLWLGPAPKIPWNERHFWHWRCYWAYGTGYAGDLLSHEMDFVQYLLGHGIPDTCCCTGLIAQLRDDRDVPDTWAATYEFEKLGEPKKSPRQPNHMEDWVNCIQGSGIPKCSTDEAFIETATFLMSLISYQKRRQVRWDTAREEIV
jgi:hypothetical protein